MALRKNTRGKNLETDSYFNNEKNIMIVVFFAACTGFFIVKRDRGSGGKATGYIDFLLPRLLQVGGNVSR